MKPVPILGIFVARSPLELVGYVGASLLPICIIVGISVMLWLS